MSWEGCCLASENSNVKEDLVQKENQRKQPPSLDHNGVPQYLSSLLSIAGIQCKTLSGYCIGYGYKAEQVIEEYESHVWSTVHLDGRWHLLDSTWGSGCVDDKGNFTFRYVVRQKVQR